MSKYDAFLLKTLNSIRTKSSSHYPELNKLCDEVTATIGGKFSSLGDDWNANKYFQVSFGPLSFVRRSFILFSITFPFGSITYKSYYYYYYIPPNFILT